MNVYLVFYYDSQTIRKCVNTATTSLQGMDQTNAVMEIPTIPHLPMDEIAMNMANVACNGSGVICRLWCVQII